MTILGKAVVLVTLATGILGVRAYVERSAATAVPTPRNPAAMATVAHTDHIPRHGGLVVMNGDTHLEVTVTDEGTCLVYFTDAVRVALPPTYASEVTIGLVSRDQRRQIALKMDPGQNVWVGRLDPIADPNAIVRVSYQATGERPYWIDLPWPALRGMTAQAQATAR